MPTWVNYQKLRDVLKLSPNNELTVDKRPCKNWLIAEQSAESGRQLGEQPPSQDFEQI